MVIIAKDSNNVARLLLVDSSGRLNILLTDGTTVPVVDADLSALNVISGPHHEIHEGEMYMASKFFSDLADNASAELRVTAGVSKALHITISIATEGNAEVYIYEGTTYNVNGTAVTVYNKNRVSTNTTDAAVKHTPTINVLGANIFQAFLPGGTKKEAVGGVRTNGQEWIFKKGIDYLIRVTNRGGADKDVSIETEYYEV